MTNDPSPRAIAGFINLDEPGGVISQCMESLDLDDIAEVSDPKCSRIDRVSLLHKLDLPVGAVALSVVSSEVDAASLTALKASLPDGLRLFIFSHEHLRVSDPDIMARHVPATSQGEFVRKVARHIEIAVRGQPAGSPLRPSASAFPVERHEIEGIENFAPIVGRRHTVRIHEAGVDFDIFADLRSGSDALVVFGQDAINRSRVELPHYFRWSWLDDLDASALILNDPTLYLDTGLDGGWWVGTPERDFIQEGTRIVAGVVNALSLTNAKVLFVGVSAGGFSSLQMASCLRGSRALVDIPQVNLKTYSQRTAANAAVRAGLGWVDVNHVSADFLYRIDVIERFRKEGHVPDLTYHQNLQDITHVDAQMGQFKDRLAGLPEAGSANVRYQEYSKWSLAKGGHFPLSRGRLLEEIELELASLRSDSTK